MSAPRTNIETQQRRHIVPLIGMAVVVTFALTLFFWLSKRGDDEGQPPQDPTTETDGRIVDPVNVEPTVPPVGDPVFPEPDLPPVEEPSPGPDLPPTPMPDNG